MNLTLILFLSLFLVGFMIVSVSYDTFAQTTSFTVKLSFAPTLIEAVPGTYKIGYVSIVDNGGIPFPAPSDLEIKLSSSNSEIASVPPSVIIPKDHDYAKFDISIGSGTGQAQISAIFADNTSTQNLVVGEVVGSIPRDAVLKMNIPTSKMNVNSEMPFAVFLERNGTVLQAPKDIPINLDYENSLILPSDDKIVIKKGNYYGITILKTLDKVGNAFIKASVPDIGLNNATAISISSTEPASLVVNVYPEAIADTEKNIDVFVSLLDSAGAPAVATQDTTLEFFSNSTDLGDSIKKSLFPQGAIIRKGEFGYHLPHEFIFKTGKAKENTISIGASAPGLGISSDNIRIIEPLSGESDKAKNKAVKVFIVNKMPSNVEAIMVYQLYAIEDDEDDRTKSIQDEMKVVADEISVAGETLEEAEEKLDKTQEDAVAASSPGGTTITASEQNDIDDAERAVDNAEMALKAAERRLENLEKILESADVNEHEIDDLKEGELYPVQSTKIYSSRSLFDNLKVLSTDTNILRILGTGEISTTTSYGTAIISTGQKTGETTVSVVLEGLGTASNKTNIVNTIKPTKTQIFSSLGDNIVFNNEGHYEMYVILLDSESRPTITTNGVKYLITPINEFIEINPDERFAKTRIYSSSFGSAAQNGTSKIDVVPIGISSDASLQSSSQFKLSGSAVSAQVILPLKVVSGIESENPVGVVQLIDYYGNPIQVSEKIVVDLDSSNPEVVMVPSSVTIDEGRSFAEFSLTTFAKQGKSMISTEANNFLSSQAEISVGSGSSKLNMLIRPETEPLSFNQGTNIMIIIDDNNYARQKDVTLTFTAQNGEVTPQSITTDVDGLATVQFKATAGPEATLTVSASKSGYDTIQDSRIIAVSGVQVVATEQFFGVPSWVMYAAVAAAVAGIGAGAYMFLRKPKTVTEEEAEEI